MPSEWPWALPAASDGYSASKIANCLNGTRFVLCTNIDTRPSRERVACVKGGGGGEKLSFEGQAKNCRRFEERISSLQDCEEFVFRIWGARIYNPEMSLLYIVL